MKQFEEIRTDVHKHNTKKKYSPDLIECATVAILTDHEEQYHLPKEHHEHISYKHSPYHNVRDRSRGRDILNMSHWLNQKFGRKRMKMEEQWEMQFNYITCQAGFHTGFLARGGKNLSGHGCHGCIMQVQQKKKKIISQKFKNI